jgi:hypothetical protein
VGKGRTQGPGWVEGRLGWVIGGDGVDSLLGLPCGEAATSERCTTCARAPVLAAAGEPAPVGGVVPTPAGAADLVAQFDDPPFGALAADPGTRVRVVVSSLVTRGAAGRGNTARVAKATLADPRHGL